MELKPFVILLTACAAVMCGSIGSWSDGYNVAMLHYDEDPRLNHTAHLVPRSMTMSRKSVYHCTPNVCCPVDKECCAMNFRCCGSDGKTYPIVLC